MACNDSGDILQYCVKEHAAVWQVMMSYSTINIAACLPIALPHVCQMRQKLRSFGGRGLYKPNHVIAIKSWCCIDCTKITHIGTVHVSCIREGRRHRPPMGSHTIPKSQLLLRTIECCRGGVKPLAVFRCAFSLPPVLRPVRPRLVVKPSLGPAQCTSPLTMGLVLYIYRAQLKPAGFSGRCQHAVYLYKPAGPYHLLSASTALTTPRRPQSGCDGLSQFKEDTGEPSVPAGVFNLIACRNLT